MTKAASISKRDIAGTAVLSLASQVFSTIHSGNIPGERRQAAFGAWYELRRLGQRIAQRPEDELAEIKVIDVIALLTQCHRAVCDSEYGLVEDESPFNQCGCNFAFLAGNVFYLIFDVLTGSPINTKKEGGSGQPPERAGGPGCLCVAGCSANGACSIHGDGGHLPKISTVREFFGLHRAIKVLFLALTVCAFLSGCSAAIRRPAWIDPQPIAHHRAGGVR